MCGPDAHFSEKFKDSIELVDDDPDAVEAVLRYLYDGDVSPKRPADWLHQLHLAKAADKYLLKGLAHSASKQFHKSTDDLDAEASIILDCIDTIRLVAKAEEHLNVAGKLEDKHLTKLLQEPKYRARVEADKKLLWKHLDAFNFVHDTSKLELVWCANCMARMLRRADGSPSQRPPGCAGGIKKCTGKLSTAECWVPNSQVQIFEKLLGNVKER